MAEVIPAINAESFEEVERKIKLIEPYVTRAHIDIADGTFTPNTLWHRASDLLRLTTPLLIEVHLMIADMDTRYGEWLLPGISRIIFHVEAAHDPHFVVEKIREAGKEVGAAIRPETEWRILLPFCETADLVQLLAVPPGRAGQAFRPETLEKVFHIRKAYPNCIIEVDGGINEAAGRQCRDAGANILVSANYIFSSPDIGAAVSMLKGERDITI